MTTNDLAKLRHYETAADVRAFAERLLNQCKTERARYEVDLQELQTTGRILGRTGVTQANLKAAINNRVGKVQALTRIIGEIDRGFVEDSSAPVDGRTVAP